MTAVILDARERANGQNYYHIRIIIDKYTIEKKAFKISYNCIK